MKLEKNVLHPHIIKKKSEVSGYGLFASKDIPQGTVIWKYGNVRVYTLEQYNNFSERYKAILRRFCYEGVNETLVYCTDDSKYFNHSCDPNSMSIDLEKDITIKNIYKEEEITYDYSYWYLKWNEPFLCKCGSKNCRHIIKRELPDSPTVTNLEQLAKESWENSSKVKQPLFENINEELW